MSKNNIINVSVNTNVPLIDFSTKITEIIRSNLAPGKMQEKIRKYHEKDVALTLTQLTKEECTSLLDLMRSDVRAEIRLVNSFDEDDIGSKMSTNFITILNTSTIKTAMSQLIQQASENDNISVLYVVDEEKTFCGAIDLKDLIIT